MEFHPTGQIYVDVIYHPLVKRDISETTHYYHKISPRLSDEFDSELKASIASAAENPKRFPTADRDLRRANLKRFPYHFFYEIKASNIRVLLVRHNKRDPAYGMERV